MFDRKATLVLGLSGKDQEDARLALLWFLVFSGGALVTLVIGGAAGAIAWPFAVAAALIDAVALFCVFAFIGALMTANEKLAIRNRTDIEHSTKIGSDRLVARTEAQRMLRTMEHAVRQMDKALDPEVSDSGRFLLLGIARDTLRESVEQGRRDQNVA